MPSSSRYARFGSPGSPVAGSMRPRPRRAADDGPRAGRRADGRAFRPQRGPRDRRDRRPRRAVDHVGRPFAGRTDQSAAVGPGSCPSACRAPRHAEAGKPLPRPSWSDDTPRSATAPSIGPAPARRGGAHVRSRRAPLDPAAKSASASPAARARRRHDRSRYGAPPSASMRRARVNRPVPPCSPRKTPRQLQRPDGKKSPRDEPGTWTTMASSRRVRIRTRPSGGVVVGRIRTLVEARHVPLVVRPRVVVLPDDITSPTPPSPRAAGDQHRPWLSTSPVWPKKLIDPAEGS